MNRLEQCITSAHDILALSQPLERKQRIASRTIDCIVPCLSPPSRAPVMHRNASAASELSTLHSCTHQKAVTHQLLLALTMV